MKLALSTQNNQNLQSPHSSEGNLGKGESDLNKCLQSEKVIRLSMALYKWIYEFSQVKLNMKIAAWTTLTKCNRSSPPGWSVKKKYWNISQNSCACRSDLTCNFTKKGSIAGIFLQILRNSLFSRTRMDSINPLSYSVTTNGP